MNILDRTHEFVGQLASNAEKAIDSPKEYWQQVLSTGATISFLLFCFLVPTLGLIKYFLL